MLETAALYQVDAFTRERFAGNPAGVLSGAGGLSSGLMQLIAREMNCSETAFILPPDADDHDVHIRYFTPTTEVPICGHATIAAHYVRAIELGLLAPHRVRAKTGIGVLPVDVRHDGTDYRIAMTQGRVEFGERLKGEHLDQILCALGLRRSDLDERCPVEVVSTGHSKILVGLGDIRSLHTLRPDLGSLAEISNLIDCSGFFAFTLDSDDPAILTHGRMFAPAIGISEDPVTGNANGPLGAYLIRHHLASASGGLFRFRARQGVHMGRPGEVDVTVSVDAGGEPTQVQVEGSAVIAFRARFEPGLFPRKRSAGRWATG